MPPALSCRLAARPAPFSVVGSACCLLHLYNEVCVGTPISRCSLSIFLFVHFCFVFAPVRLAKTNDLAGSSPPFWHCLGLEAIQDSGGTREGTLGSGFTFHVFLSDLGIPLSHCVYCLGHKCLFKVCFDAFPMM